MKDVLKIEDGVLKECTDKDVESVVIPEGVTEIGGCTFKGCNINEFSHPLLTIKNGVAIRDNEVLCCASQSTSVVTIPEDVTKISDYAFSHCESLSSVEIPSSVTVIGACAFECCTSLESVAFGGTVAQWKAVEKEADWHYGVPASSVKCSDGKSFEEDNECFEEDDEYFDDDDED